MANLPMDKAPLNDLEDLSVAYINHDGNEFPIKNIDDFDKAFKSAKCKVKNQLNLILYDKKPKQNVASNNTKFAILGSFSKKEKVAVGTKRKKSPYSCQCTEEPIPEWFRKYMKEFKKELLQNVKSVIIETILEEFKKEKTLDQSKPLPTSSDKNELSSPKKKKNNTNNSDKVTVDMLEKRDKKLLKKIEEFHSSKFDNLIEPILFLDKIESKAKVLFEERKKLLERGHEMLRWKSGDDEKPWDFEKMKSTKGEKSALFQESTVSLNLKPGEEFSIPVYILNNGTLPWRAPRMECLKTGAFCLKHQFIDLPPLEPGQSCNTVIKGRVTQKVGNYYFAYKLFDGVKEFGPLFCCFAVVSNSKEKVVSKASQKVNEDFPTEGSVGTLIDFEKGVIAGSQKKIKDNIIEIEKRLHDIDLLKPCTSSDESREKRLDDDAREFQACDLLQDREKLEEDVFLGLDLSEEKVETEIGEQKCVNIENENSEKKDGVESESDSELSVIFMSEEDENFIFVPLPSDTGSPKSTSERENLLKLDSKKEFNQSNQKPKEIINDEVPIKVGLREVNAAEGYLSTQSSQEANIKLTDDLELPIKAETSVACNLTSPPARQVATGKTFKENVPDKLSFKPIAGGSFFAEETTPDLTSAFKSVSACSCSAEGTKTKGKRNDDDKNSNNKVLFTPEGVKKDTARNEPSVLNIPTRKGSGKPVYVVRDDGYCLPIDENFETSEEDNRVGEWNTNDTGNAAEGPTVTDIPNALISSASSVASMAFNTAKFVINNLQSALKPEGQAAPRDDIRPARNGSSHTLHSTGAESRPYSEELTNQEKYIDALLTLHEMGFVKHALNSHLLEKHDNDVNKVVNEILDTPLERTPRET